MSDIDYNPWEELGKEGNKEISLEEALKELNVSKKEAPKVKREMIDKVEKLTKDKNAKKVK